MSSRQLTEASSECSGSVWWCGQDFVSVCIESSFDGLLSLVLGVTSSCDAVHRGLSHAVTARLTLTQFELPLPATVVSGLHKLLWEEALEGCVLSGSVLRVLLERFSHTHSWLTE